MRTRAERRHHAKRIEAKFRQVAERWAGSLSGRQLRWKRVAFGPNGRVRVLDTEAEHKRRQVVERNVERLRSTHGRPCSCFGCKRGPRPAKTGAEEGGR